MFGMVAATTVPLLVFVAFLLVQLESSERAAQFRRIGREAVALAGSVGRQIQDTKTTLRLLAAAPEFETVDLEAFHTRTRAALNGSSMFVLVVKADGEQLLNTRVPFSTALGKTANPQSLANALQSDGVEVSDVFLGKTSGKWVFNVTQSLGRDTPSGAAALILTQNAEELGSLLGNLAPSASAVVIDETGHVLSAAGDAIAKPGDAFLSVPLSSFSAGSGVFEQGANTVAYAQPADTTWRLILWGPTRTITAAFFADWWVLLLAGFALIVFALSAAFFLGRQLSSSIQRIADMAARLGRGEIVAPVATPIVEVNHVAITLTNASYDRSEAEHKLWYTMREAVHRTKNMMSVVQAMMRQTARHSTTVEEFQSKMQGRLAGLGQTVDLLTAGEWEGTSMVQLAQTQIRSFDLETGRIDLSGEDFAVKPEVVQALGMAVHELATNAVKYGALSNRNGRIAFTWGINPSDDNEMIFQWIEKGGPIISPPDQTGFGTALLDGYVAAAVNGRVMLDYSSSGLKWRLTALRSAVDVDRAARPAAPKSAEG